MPENDFDLDAWLDGAKRTERAVTVYARADLLADIDRLEAEKATEEAANGLERSFGDLATPARIQAKIDALYVQMDASKLELRVGTLVDDELEAIRTKTQAEIKGDLDEAAKNAREDAKVQCKRAEITAVNDINQIVRNAAMAAVKATLDREVNIRTVAAALVHPRMSVDQVRKLYAKIGDAQVGLISKAYTRASIETPQVQVPKSLAPSHSDDGAMSS